MKLKILVGLNDDCPVEEHVEVRAIEAYPLRVTDPDDEYECVDIRDENELREWAYRYYNVHKLAEVAVSDGTPLTAVRRAAASFAGAEGPTGPPETIGIGPEGAAFPGRPTTADEHDNEADTRLVRVAYADDTCEWEAHCVEPCIPGTAEVVCASEKGPLDALHQLKASLTTLGLPCRPYVTHIARVALALDD